jgi:hypothetical protein
MTSSRYRIPKRGSTIRALMRTTLLRTMLRILLPTTHLRPHLKIKLLVSSVSGIALPVRAVKPQKPEKRPAAPKRQRRRCNDSLKTSNDVSNCRGLTSLQKSSVGTMRIFSPSPLNNEHLPNLSS